jgi:hypothetical protein
MYVDGARAPMAAGAPALYGQIANASMTAVAPANPAPATAPATAPSSTPAPASANCVQTTSTQGPYDNQAELQETRRMLQVYRHEFESLKRKVESAGVKTQEIVEEDVPPAPAALRQTTLKLRERASSKILEAGYAEENLEDEEIPQPVRRALRQPVQNKTSAARKTPPNVGHSYQVNEDPDAEGLGVWQEEDERPVRVTKRRTSK